MNNNKIPPVKKLSDFLFEIPKEYRDGMKVPARIFASEKMLGQISRDNSINQLINITTLQGVAGPALVMPDAHEGYGFPIGGVAAFDLDSGVVSPGGIGYDINCGVRLLISDIRYKDIKEMSARVADIMFDKVPSGVGRGGNVRFKGKDYLEILNGGAESAVFYGFGEKEDLENIESYGKISGADFKFVSEHARKRGKDQLGTLGAGNHFLEIGRVEEIFDPETATQMGLYPDVITVLVHTGSRGFGHQVATDYIRRMVNSLEKYSLKVPDLQLSCTPIGSHEGKSYLSAMAAAANFAFANRQIITHLIRSLWQEIFGTGHKLKLLYDVAHNIAKIEEHTIEGKQKKVLVHRKGATRAFPPKHKDIPVKFRKTGQPVIIPGSMGTASYVLTGSDSSMNLSYGSCCHGAGRKMSRKESKRKTGGIEVKNKLLGENVIIKAGSLDGIAEEAPLAYKNIDEVVDIVANAGIAKKIARLKPVIVIKG